MPHDSPWRRVDWPGVLVFCLVAGLVSTPLLLWRDLRPASWAASPIPGWLRPLLYGYGPALGALVALRLRRGRHERTVTLLGGAPLGSLLVVLAPVLAAATMVRVPAGAPRGWGLVVGLHAAAYALGEELGWRGYLQDALRPLGGWPRWTVLGVLWGAWHVTTFAGHGTAAQTALRLAVFYAVLVLASAAIGSAVERTRSVLVATACHLFYTFSQMFAGRDRWVVLGALGLAVFAVTHFWPALQALGARPRTRAASSP